MKLFKIFVTLVLFLQVHKIWGSCYNTPNYNRQVSCSDEYFIARNINDLFEYNDSNYGFQNGKYKNLRIAFNPASYEKFPGYYADSLDIFSPCHLFVRENTSVDMSLARICFEGSQGVTVAFPFTVKSDYLGIRSLEGKVVMGGNINFSGYSFDITAQDFKLRANSKITGLPSRSYISIFVSEANPPGRIVIDRNSIIEAYSIYLTSNGIILLENNVRLVATEELFLNNYGHNILPEYHLKNIHLKKNVALSGKDIDIRATNNLILAPGVNIASEQFLRGNSRGCIINRNASVDALVVDGVKYISGNCFEEDPNRPPRIKEASASVTQGNLPLTVNFSASVKDLDEREDGPGTYTYTWYFDDGTTAIGKSASHIFNTRGGIHNVTVTAYDSDNSYGHQTIPINVNDTRDFPTASFTATPTSGRVSLEVSFDGSASDDSDGEIENYLWDFGDGGSSTEVSPTHTYRYQDDTRGIYVATLKVTDGDGPSHETSKVIRVNPNIPPNASFEFTPESGRVPLEVSFDGSGSDDPDGEIENYFWYFGDGDTSVEVSPTHTYREGGYFGVQLRVQDSDDDYGYAYDDITVTPQMPPVASFTASPTEGLTPLQVSFDSSASNDPDGKIAEYHWDFGDDNESTEVSPTHTYNVSGEYEVNLRIVDDEDFEDTATLTITVHNNPPVASFTATPISGFIPLEVSFDTSSSSDFDGTIDRYFWDFDDGTKTTGQRNPIHYYEDAGEYEALLRIVDNEGASTSTTRTITLTDRPQEAPVMSGNDAFSVTENNILEFILTGATDSNDDFITYHLVGSIPDTQGELSNCLGGTDSLECIFTPAKNFTGEMTFSYKANDATSDSSTNANVVITVNANNPPMANITPVMNIQIGQIVTLNGETSTDTEGSPLFYDWSLKTKPQDSALVLGSTMSSMASFVPDRDGNYIFQLIVEDEQDRSSPREITVSVPPNNSPVLTGVSNKTLTIGETVSFTVGANDQDGDDITFFALNIPQGASFNSNTQVFKWRPASTQTGTHRTVFKAKDRLSSIRQEITITVNAPPAGTPTSFKGRVIDSNSFAEGVVLPIQGVKVSVTGLKTVVTSDANGYFTLSNILSGRRRASFNASSASGPSNTKYADFHGMINFTANAINDTGRAFMLPRIDSGGTAIVQAGEMTMLANERLGVSVEVPADSVMKPDGTPFTGQLSLSEVPPSATPAQLPAEFRPSKIISLQPAGLTFTTPAQVTFPNSDHYAPGSIVEIYSLDSTQGRFYRSGRGRVTTDGTKIETFEGGLRDSSWHFPAPPPIVFQGFIGQGDGDNNPSNDGLVNANVNNCATSIAGVDLFNGNNFIDTNCPNRKGNQEAGLAYNSGSIRDEMQLNQKPKIAFNPGAPVANKMAISVELGGVRSAETFFDTSSIATVASATQTARGEFPIAQQQQVAGFDLASSVKIDELETGIYSTTFILAQEFSSGTARETRIPGGSFSVVKRDKSSFGAGWSFGELHRIYFDGNDSRRNNLLLVFGNASRMTFRKSFGSAYTSPVGDYSSLQRNINGWVRTRKNGLKYYFNSEGFLTAKVDRNNNTTTYQYDASDRIKKIIDPYGRSTDFVYGTDGMIDSITYPTGRRVSYTHDTQGNLAMITRPDGSQMMYGHGDSHRLTSTMEMVDGTMRLKNYAYNEQGGVKQVTLADGSVSKVTPANIMTMRGADGTRSNPIPLSMGEEIEKMAESFDGAGNKTQTVLNDFGSKIAETDALNNTSITERDGNNNPIKLTDRRGMQTVYIYDNRGNILTGTIDNQTTSYSYEPTFNQVTRIEYPDETFESFVYDGQGNLLESTNQKGEKSRYRYNNRGQVMESIDPQGRKTATEYDELGRVFTTTSPAGLTTSFEYDTFDNIIKTTDSKGGFVRRTFDGEGRVLTQTDQTGAVATFTYTSSGQVKTLTDAKNNITTFGYDELDRLIERKDALDRKEAFVYNDAGNLVESTDRNGNTSIYEYDSLNREIKRILPDDVITYSYDAEGNLLEMADSDSQTSYSYSAKSEILSRTTDHENAIPVIISYRYDELGRKISMRNNVNGKMVKYEYDDAGQVVHIGEFNFIYDDGGKLVKTLLPNDVIIKHDYDQEQRLISSTHKLISATLLGFAYNYDNNGNITKITKTTGVSTLRNILNYTYNARDELLTGTHPITTGTNESYTYDHLGNRLTQAGQTTAPVYNALNQLISDQTYTYTYDNNGNQISRVNKSNHQMLVYKWNSQNKLVEVRKKASLTAMPSKTVEFRHDAEGNKIRKTVGSTVAQYVHDGDNRIFDLDGRHAITAEYIHGLEIDEPLFMIRGGSTYYYHRNHLGSIVALSNDAGAVVQRYAYDAYGNTYYFNATGIQTTTPTIKTPFTFTAREYDEDVDMFDNRARWYNHKTGRFVSADPTGFGGGVNPYIYAQNNSLKYTDPYGLKVVLRPGKRLPTNKKLLGILKKIDEEYDGKDVIVTSGVRTPVEQEKIRRGSGFFIPTDDCSSNKISQHVIGTAVDIIVEGIHSNTLANKAQKFKATGTIGYKYLPHAHVDVRVGSPWHPRNYVPKN